MNFMRLKYAHFGLVLGLFSLLTVWEVFTSEAEIDSLDASPQKSIEPANLKKTTFMTLRHCTALREAVKNVLADFFR